MLASQKHTPPEDMNVRIASEYDDPLKPKGYRTFRCDTDSIKEDPKQNHQKSRETYQMPQIISAAVFQKLTQNRDQYSHCSNFK